LTLEHDDVRVSDLDAGFIRAPNTACRGATGGLAALIGLPIEATISTLARLPESSNCTHLSDLASWTLSQIGRTALWEIAVPDQIEEPVWIEITRDGALMHRWQVESRRIVAPPPLAGRPLMKGFMAWARPAFDEDELLGATMLQRGVFVARGRERVVDQGAPTPLVHAQGMAGKCWSYSGSRLENATGTLNYVRDFTNGVTPENPPSHVAERLQGAGS
jgi:hypothetical protein